MIMVSVSVSTNIAARLTVENIKASYQVCFLPCSGACVFSHLDIAPFNIMLDHKCLGITGTINWEIAGWYLN